jgi:two-component system response regulator HydG
MESAKKHIELSGLTLERKSTETFGSSSDKQRLDEVVPLLSGSSAAVNLLRSQISRVGPYFRTALLTGEPGCGDEAVARALHDASPLRERVFLELTPAEAKLWLNGGSSAFSLATAGMIYLPQPDLLERAEQAALLRLLRTRGTNSPRLVAYAEHGLRPLVSTGTFLPELAATLGSLHISLPPLRERREDVPELFDRMLQRIAEDEQAQPPQSSPALRDALMQHSWPENLDQLQLVAQRLWKNRNGDALHDSDLQAALESLPQPTHDRRAVRLVRLEQVIQEHIRSVLFACGGNKLRASEVLGISRSTLYRMLDAPIPAPQSAAAPRERMLLAS